MKIKARSGIPGAPVPGWRNRNRVHCLGRAAWLLVGLLTLELAAENQDGPAVFIPQWKHQAQFAGYYAALDQGFFTRRGLDVKILCGGPDQPAARMVADGRADFGTLFLADAIGQRARGLPLVNIAQVVQRSSLMLVARKSSGIRAPSDLAGRKVSLWADFRVQPEALFRQFGIAPRIVNQGATINLFLRGGVDAASAMWYNEYHLLLNAGLDADELTVFFYDAYGLNFPEDGIYCRTETLRDQPARCRAFVQAALEGWRYAFAHPEQALDMVMRHMSAPDYAANRAHQRWMLARMRDIILPADRPAELGVLQPEDFRRVAEALQARGMIAAAPALSDFYANCAKPE